MLLKRADKEQLVEQMIDRLENAKTAVLVNYQGLKVNEIQNLKKKLREQNIEFQIVKNTLFRLALKKRGIDFDEAILDQPVAVVWGTGDEVIPAKLTVDFAKEAEKLQIIGAVVNGAYSDANTVKTLAALPGRDELYGKLVGALNAPMYRLVNALQGNLRSLVYILDQYAKQKI